MPRHRRDRLETYRDVLMTLYLNEGPMKPTVIMRQANIQWMIMNDIMRQMISRKLIRKAGSDDKRSPVRYDLTEKGKIALRMIHDLIIYLLGTEPDIKLPVWMMHKLYELKEPKPAKTERGWHICPDCGKEIPSERGLKIHRSRLHGEKVKKVSVSH